MRMVVRNMSNRLMRIIIVDDEPIICEGLQKTINWAMLGAEVAGIAYDGEEALRLAAALAPDIVLSDIRMDGMDGLELAERLRQVNPQLIVIMISGYEDFEYARRAVRIGVTDYLLKPVEIDELMGVVGRAIERIREQEKAGAPEEDLLWFLSAIDGKPTYTESPLQRRSGWENQAYRIIVSQIENYGNHYIDLPDDARKQLQGQWLQAIDGALHNGGLRALSAFAHPNLLFTLVAAPESDDEAEWEARLEQAMLAWQGEGVLYCALSPAYTKLGETAAICDKARQQLAYHVLRTGSVLSEQACRKLEAGRQQRRGLGIVPDWAARLSGMLFRQEREEANQLVRELFALMREHQLLLTEALSLLEEQVALLRQRLRHSGLPAELAAEQKLHIDLHIHNSFAAVEELVLTELAALSAAISSQAMNKFYWAVEKAIRYMEEHYGQDLKASEVAAWLNITPSHFSYIFKQNTGKNFKEYMNSLRIEHARRLLETTNDKVFEIADQVGYSEYKYFVSVFKAVTGLTPKEYRAMKAGQ